MSVTQVYPQYTKPKG